MELRNVERLAAIAFAAAALVPVLGGLFLIVAQAPPSPDCFEWCGLGTTIGVSLVGVGGIGLAWAVAMWFRQRWAQILSVPACVVAGAYATGTLLETRFQTQFLLLEIVIAAMTIAWCASGLLTIYVLADWITARRER